MIFKRNMSSVQRQSRLLNQSRHRIYSLLILEGLNTRKKSSLMRLFQDVQYNFCHNKKVEIKGKFLNNLLLLLLVAISIDFAICLIPRAAYPNLATITHVVCSSNTFDFIANILGVLAKKKKKNAISIKGKCILFCLGYRTPSLLLPFVCKRRYKFV